MDFIHLVVLHKHTGIGLGGFNKFEEPMKKRKVKKRLQQCPS